MNKLVGIAGGSGSGKSTLAIALTKKYPELVTLVHLDDFFKKTSDAPHLPDGSVDWDSPDALRFDDLLRDLKKLMSGEPITLLTKGELYNPGYKNDLKNRLEYTLEPKPIILLEGYLALYDSKIRRIMEVSIFLDIEIEKSVMRRSVNKSIFSQKYFEKVLIPVHHSYVEPTKKYTSLVVDVTTHSQEKVLSRTEEFLKKKGILPSKK